jgi:hypothetical protein
MNEMVLRPRSFGDLVQFSQMAARSSMVPPAYKGKPEDIMLAVQMGSELGLAPMQSLQNVAVVNGRPSVYGDAIPALCKASPQFVDLVEELEHEGTDQMAAVCTAVRKGATPVIARFSVADAKKAGLWGKQGPWTQYPKRMLQMRARGFACRDQFPDVLRGLISAEEAGDIPKPPTGGETNEPPATTIEAAAEPPAPVSFIDRLDRAMELATDDTKLFRLLTKVLPQCTSLDDLGAVRGYQRVQAFMAAAPKMLRDDVQALMAEAVKRLAPKFDAGHPADEDDDFPGDRPFDEDAATDPQE